MYRPTSEQVLAEREHGLGEARPEAAVADGADITSAETTPSGNPGRWEGG
jgi:hypothetical protein